MLSARRSDYIVPTNRGQQSAILIDRIDSADPAGMIGMQLPVSEGQEREVAFSLAERGGATSSCGRSDEHRCASRPSPQFDFGGRGMDLPSISLAAPPRGAGAAGRIGRS